MATLAKVIDWKTSKGSDGLRRLQLATSQERAKLSELTEPELQALLRDALYDLDHEKLRGWKPLSQTLKETDDNGYVFDLQADAAVQMDDSTIEPMTLGSPVNDELKRSLLRHKQTWRDRDTGNETHDSDVAISWGQGNSFVVRGEISRLMLRKSPPCEGPAKAIIIVRYKYEKIPHKKKYEVHSIVCSSLTPDNLHATFAHQAASVAFDVISGLRDIVLTTARELESEATRYRRFAKDWERLADSIQ